MKTQENKELQKEIKHLKIGLFIYIVLTILISTIVVGAHELSGIRILGLSFPFMFIYAVVLAFFSFETENGGNKKSRGWLLFGYSIAYFLSYIMMLIGFGTMLDAFIH